jgi:hypothetical protein
MTAYELAHLLLWNIEQGNIDADDPVMENMGAYCREVTSAWVDNGVHLGSQPLVSYLARPGDQQDKETELQHPPEEELL